MQNLRTRLDQKELKLTIVIGANNARESIGECLVALESQRNGREVEIIVADNSTDGTGKIVLANFPNVKHVRSPDSKFIPELWEAGINQSTGQIVALLTAHCVPGKNWTEEVLRAHEENSHPGIGGAIENDGSAGLVEWAIYLCRYSPFMLPFSQHEVKDIPGDNASYKRWALEQCKEIRQNGFWEPEVHSELRKEGFQLLLTPKVVVHHKRSFSFLSFMNQRFWHGRQFGMDRASHFSYARRGFYVLLSPLIPLIFLSRITRHVLSTRRHIFALLLCFPLLVMFLLSWSAGEVTGYLSAH